MPNRLPNCTLRVEFDQMTWGDLRRLADLSGLYSDDDPVGYIWPSGDPMLGPDGIEFVPTLATETRPSDA